MFVCASAACAVPLALVTLTPPLPPRRLAVQPFACASETCRSQDQVAADAAPTLLAGGVHREPFYISPALVDELRQEMAELGETFTFGVSYGSDGRPDDLRSALRCTPRLECQAFASLYVQLSELRAALGPLLGCQLATGMEVAYVVYPAGGYYKRHIDSSDGVDDAGSGRRRVSFIAYLNELGWREDDGGALRIHGGDDADGGSSHGYDLLPEGGSLVLFDSKQVWHEVLPTRRERACVVGWMLEEPQL